MRLMLDTVKEIEHAKIELADRQMAAQIEENKRQHEIRTARLTSDKDTADKKIAFGNKVFFFVFALVAVVIAVLLAAAFFGNEQQRETALRFGDVIRSALAGLGAIALIFIAWKKFAQFFNGNNNENQ